MAQLRSMTADDLDEVAELLNRIFRWTNNVYDQDVLTDFPLVFAPQNYHNCRVVVEDGRVVSHAAIWPRTMIVDSLALKTAIIVLVATEPARRMKGHAAALMRDLQRTMADEEYDLGVLWTGVPDFYAKLGWKVVTPRGAMIEDIGEVACKHSLSEEMTVEPYDEAKHLDAIVRLHDAEPVRMARSRAEFAELLKLPKVETLVVNEGAAYAVHAAARNKHGIIEYGGTARRVDVVVSLLHQTRMEARPIPLLLYHPYDELAASYRNQGAKVIDLESSKGRGVEMILEVRPGQVDQATLDQLFVWGLDYA